MKEITFKENSFGMRLKSMLRVDFRRMFTTPLIYIIVGICLAMPILILVMTGMMAEAPAAELPGESNVENAVDVADSELSNTDVPANEIEGEPVDSFDNVWQIIGSVSDAPDAEQTGENSANEKDAETGMSIVGMCNINMLYFLIAVLVCLFVAADFRSGYAKNLFAVRAGKTDYVISKTVVCAVGGMMMLLAFFIGALLGGAIMSISFEMVGFGVHNLILCLMSKLLLVLVFVPIYVVLSVAAKQRTWLSICLSLAAGMLLFAMIPMLTPLNSGVINMLGCLAGGALFSVGLGAVSRLVLDKTSLV
ncbi:MAG: ABC transporter permease [Clostridia bacterium]|nr:ABC transporter permease [Clostridia bacterium]